MKLHTIFQNFVDNYRPQTTLRKGNVFTSVCQEFWPQWVYTPGADKQTAPLADTPPPRQTAPGQTPPPRASYWNAFLLVTRKHSIMERHFG